MAQVNKKYRLIDKLLTGKGLAVLDEVLAGMIRTAREKGTDDELQELFEIRKYVQEVKAEASE